MKLIFFIIFCFFNTNLFAQRINFFEQKLSQTKEISLEGLSEKILKDRITFKDFLDHFFSDFTANKNTKILELNKQTPCFNTYCFDLKLNYFYFANNKENNLIIDSRVTIDFRQNTSTIEIKNQIPDSIQLLLKVTPDSWTEDFPILAKATIQLEKINDGLELSSKIYTFNDVIPSVLEEFNDDLITSFYFNLKEFSKIP